ncbi:MAG: nucleoside deaminase [Myxococcota bacterium]
MQPADFAHAIELSLPDWTRELLAAQPSFSATIEERMRLTLCAARENFERDTGGPFAAAVFEEQSGRLVSLGVNRVVPMSCSSAHAEVMALSLAQRRLGTFDLGARGLPAHQLVVNWRPCAMCFGAIPWSGVRSLVIAGGGPAIEELTGFDEGPIHPDWARELQLRGIQVTEGVLESEAWNLFQDFAKSGRLVYNARQG